MCLGYADIPLHGPSKRYGILLDVSKVLRLEEILGGINHRQRNVALAYHLLKVSSDSMISSPVAYQYKS